MVVSKDERSNLKPVLDVVGNGAPKRAGCCKRFNKPLPKDVGFSSFDEGLGGLFPPNPEKERGYPERVRDR